MNRIVMAGLIASSMVVPAFGQQKVRAELKLPANAPPPGFKALFNGKDLSGWRGLGGTNPYEIAKWTPEQRKEKGEAGDADMRKHWRAENGEIINDGRGVYLTTAKDYRDFELWVDWKMTPKADSGIYLRGSPQVQIWDPNDAGQKGNGADKGSGALWNNSGEGKFPPVKADNPPGQWNTFKITMIGERVTVLFNGKKTVDNAVMENYWNRKIPMLASGPIQLQTHGGEFRFRNVFIREISPADVNKSLQAHGDKGFKTIFNGKDLTGWKGATKAYYTKENGILAIKAGGGGTLCTAENYDDFALRFEFKLPPGGNNGLAIRYPGEGDPAYAGMEFQILDDPHPKYAGIKPWQAHGSVYGIAPAARGHLRPPGQWNYQEVVARGSLIQVRVNGTKIVDTDLSKVTEPVDGQDHPGMRRKGGHIGFAGHGDAVEFRNIRIKRLK